jgi:hypothetical protein
MKDFSSKIDVLVRLGLMPIADLPWLKKAFGHVRQNMYLPIQERKVFYQFINDFLEVVLDNPALLRLVMNRTGAIRRNPLGESVKKKYKKAFPKGDKHTDTGASSIGDVQNRPPTASEETDMADVQKLIEHIRRSGSGFVVTNRSGSKILGYHKSHISAVKQLQAIEAHKHMGEQTEEDWDIPEYGPTDKNTLKLRKKKLKAVAKTHKEEIDHKKNTHKDYANIKGLDGSCAETHAGGPCAKCGFQIESVRENIPRKHADGAKVRVPHNGHMVSGKVVRHDKGDPHGSPFYVVDVGKYESLKVPAHKVEHHKGADENEHRTSVNVKESIDLTEEINLRKASLNTLRTFAVAPTRKKKAGGHITTHDKQLASAAKKELLRRRHHGLGEHMDYAQRFTDALEHFGVKDVTELDLDTTKDFLAYVDTLDEGVISANSQKHLPVSDEIKSRVAADIAARNANKARLMAAAKAEYQAHVDSKKGPSAARALFRKDLKASKEVKEEVELSEWKLYPGKFCWGCGVSGSKTEMHKEGGHHYCSASCFNKKKSHEDSPSLEDKGKRLGSYKEEAGSVLDTSPNVANVKAKVRTTKKNRKTQGYFKK